MSNATLTMTGVLGPKLCFISQPLVSHSSGGPFTIENKCWCRMKFPPLQTWSARVASLVEGHCRAVGPSAHSQVRILPHLGSQRLKRRSKPSGRVQRDPIKNIMNLGQIISNYVYIYIAQKTCQNFDIRSESGWRLNHAVHFSAHQEVGEGNTTGIH